MKNRGRQSAASLVPLPVTGRRSRLTAPASLTTKERAAFTELVASVGDGHLVASDIPLIISYVQSCMDAQSLAHKPSQRSEWREAVKLQMALARSLRLTVQSRVDPKTITRGMPHLGERPWTRDDEEED
jgi:hypothetical protein